MTPPAPGQGGLDEGTARILVVVGTAVPQSVHEACDGLRPARSRAAASQTWEFTPAPPAAAPMWESSHHGHRHASGTGHHSHGPARGPSAGA